MLQSSRSGNRASSSPTKYLQTTFRTPEKSEACNIIEKEGGW